LWLPDEARGNQKVINALEFYTEGRLRVQNYELVARAIIEAADLDRPVGYVTYGNPMSYDRVAQNLIEYANESKLMVKIVPGISSLDTILCDLNADMAPAIQIFDASWFIACQLRPTTEIAVLLMQVGAFGSLRTHYRDRPDGSSLAQLVEYLCQFYPRSHKVSLVRSTGEEEQPAKVRSLEIGELCRATANDLSGASLYLPAAKILRPDERFVRQMEET
jgi:uncharacterized protein YabN with tetrapyrrole methylase and pyrophosphatase domain